MLPGDLRWDYHDAPECDPKNVSSCNDAMNREIIQRSFSEIYTDHIQLLRALNN